MAIKYGCSCGKRFSAEDKYAGRKTRCMHCGREFYIPLASAVQIDKPEVAEPALSGLIKAGVVHEVQPLSTGSDRSQSPDFRWSQSAQRPKPRRNFLPVWIAWGVLAVFLAVCWGIWLARPPLGTREIVERAESSVAQIKGSIGSGTGFLVGKNLLATNAHVIRFEFAKDVEIHFPSATKEVGSPYSARVVYEDTKRDLAILGIQVNLPPLGHLNGQTHSE